MHKLQKTVICLGAGCITHFFVDFYSSFLLPLLPVFAQKFELSILTISILMSASYFLSSIMQPVWGCIADRQKKNYFMVLGYVLTCVCITMTFYTHNMYFLFALILLANFGEGIFHPQATGFIADHCEKEVINKNLGAFLSLGTLGFAVGPVLCGFIADSLSKSYSHIILILLLFVSALFTPMILCSQNKTVSKLDIIPLFEEIFVNRRLIKIIAIGFIRPLILVTMCVYLPFFWSQAGFSNLKTGIFLGLFSLTGALGAFCGGRLFNGENKLLFFKISIIFTTVFGLLYLKFINQGFAFVFFLLTSFCANIIASINLSLSHEIIPENKAALSGFINGFNWGVVGLLLWIAGLFIEKYDIMTVLAVVLLIPPLFLFNSKSLFKQ